VLVRRTVVRVSGERGAVAVLVAILMPGLLFLFLLVIDVGNWYVHHRHLQMQADAAALAGGARFGDCFSPDATVVSNAATSMQQAAAAYGGTSAGDYNVQVASGTPDSSTVVALYNSKTFARGGPGPDDTTADPCTAPYMFDVKQTDEDVPYVLAGLVNALVPSASTVVPAINARARIELKKSTVLEGSLPLAVPDVDPKHVTVTYVNEADGSLVAGPFELTKESSANGLWYWSGSSDVTLPADANVGIRIGLGAQSATCAGANGTGGDGFVCYDYADPDIGLATIRSVGSGGTVDQPKPRVWATTTCAPSGGPFFAPKDIVAPATSCSASIQAVLQTSGGAVTDPAKMKLFQAVLNGAGLKNASAPLTYDSADGYWTTGYVYAVPGDGGPVDVTLQWRSTTGTTQTYSGVQRVYSGADDTSGPVKELSVSSTTATTGSPYTLSTGTHTLTVTVGVEGSLDLTNQTQTTMLRLTGGSRTTAIACDGPGASLFDNSLQNGCQTPYGINAAGYCPDPDPPADYATCVPTETGEMAGPTLHGLDARFASCPAVNWPDEDVATDPRVIKLMITDFSSLGGNGTTEVPVTNFAAFYVTGWTGSKCTNNDPPPPNLSIKKGAIWGHFVKYVAPDPLSYGTESCDPLAITPCVPVLVK
jgi:hypothetical protein